MKICNAVTSDVKEIYSLIEVYAKEGVVLPRSLLSLSIFTMFICYERRGENRWSCWFTCIREDLAEVRSLVVSHTYAGKGIGRMLVNHVINEAAKIKVSRVISLTYETEFFKSVGLIL